ncbi:MAG: hypothetical protein NVSMB70_19140 [Chamaesiphon sp.]
MSNIKIKLLIKTETGEELGDLYAKVTEKLADSDAGFYIRFTALSPAMEAMLSTVVTQNNVGRVEQ